MNSPYIQGTVIDGGAFGGDTDLATDWFTKVDGLTWSGNQQVSDGAVFYLLAHGRSTVLAHELRSSRPSTGSTSVAATSRASPATSTTSPAT